jgi:PAS domain S-box-containing protein
MTASVEMALHKHLEDQTYTRGKSDLKRTTEALRASEALVKQTEDRFRVLVEAAPNALIMVGADGIIALVNAQTEQLFGYQRGDLLGQSIEMLLPERFRHHHVGLRSGFLAAPGMRPMGVGRELFARRQDGSEVPIEIGLNPISTGDGQFVVASIVDISERISYQRERDQLISRLKEALKEKTVLLQEVHHRMKNNLAVVAAFLGMQANSVQDGRLTTMLEKSQQRVASMALIHEYLYSGHLDHVSFGQYARKLIDELTVAYAASGRVVISTEAEEINLPMDCAIPCGLILNELLSNALKYAFPDDRSGRITVRFCRLETGELALSCQDDGVGIPESLDWETAPSLGLRIIQILTKQLKGKLRLDRSGGTRFELTFREMA